MRVAITGSSGLVGTALRARLQDAGHQVDAIHRGAPGDHGARWDPARHWIAEGSLDRCDAVVHLAGASIGEGRWTDARKRELRSSRIDATRLLVDHLASLSSPPRTLVSASAVGYYGDRGDAPVDEATPPGSGFLAALAQDWEAEALNARRLGIRVVTPRFGVILARHAGALPRMMLPVRLGVGGPLGSGRQWLPWVTLHDTVRALEFMLTSDFEGPANVVAPAIARNGAFTKALAGVLRRPAIAPTPGFALRLLLGQAADELLLASTRAMPARLEAAGFAFEHPTLDVALPAVLDRPTMRPTAKARS